MESEHSTPNPKAQDKSQAVASSRKQSQAAVARRLRIGRCLRWIGSFRLIPAAHPGSFAVHRLNCWTHTQDVGRFFTRVRVSYFWNQGRARDDASADVDGWWLMWLMIIWWWGCCCCYSCSFFLIPFVIPQFISFLLKRYHMHSLPTPSVPVMPMTWKAWRDCETNVWKNISSPRKQQQDSLSWSSSRV